MRVVFPPRGPSVDRFFCVGLNEADLRPGRPGTNWKNVWNWSLKRSTRR